MPKTIPFGNGFYMFILCVFIRDAYGEGMAFGSVLLTLVSNKHQIVINDWIIKIKHVHNITEHGNVIEHGGCQS